VLRHTTRSEDAVTSADAPSHDDSGPPEPTGLDRYGLGPEVLRLRARVRAQLAALGELGRDDPRYEQAAAAVLETAAQLLAVEATVPVLLDAHRHRRDSRWVYAGSVAAGATAVVVTAIAVIGQVSRSWIALGLPLGTTATAVAGWYRSSVVGHTGYRMAAALILAASAAVVLMVTGLLSAWWSVPVIALMVMSFGSMIASDAAADEDARQPGEAGTGA
jgi:hypothetical protein